MGKKQTMLSEQIRRAVDASELTRYRIAVNAGINHASLSRFMHGKVGLSMAALDALGKVLDLQLAKKKRTEKKVR
ncbi:MAG: hypothetical protein SVV80_10670 [Planctomycetota bacterium]|nr:hypothetical protein [Planctomycetota bacterium]